MKSAFVFAIALFVCATTAAAQGPSVGIRAGVNFATLSVSDTSDGFDPKNRAGWVGGLFVTVPVNGIFAFQPELLVSSQGATFTEDGETGTLKLTYFQVPLLARIKPGKASPVGILVGPAIGVRTSAKISFGGQNEDIKNEVEGTDFGLVTGIAVDVGRHFVLDGRYTFGLRQIDREDSSDRVKNRVLSLSAGIRF